MLKIVSKVKIKNEEIKNNQWQLCKQHKTKGWISSKTTRDIRNVRNKHFGGRTVNREHVGTLHEGSVRERVTKGGSSAMKAGCCGADQKALISSLGSFLALDP